MPLRFWSCDKCHALYDFEQAAKGCEASHAERMKTAEIVGEAWKGDKKHGREYPSQLTVKFSDDGFDFATYSLKEIGSHGL
jgi:hypothetical protein